MTALPSITLLPNKEESVRRFHPWIFSGAIASISGNPAEGDPVRIFSSKHEPLGIGHYEKGSIAVRMLSFDIDMVLDVSFWEERLSATFRLRSALGLIRYDDTRSKNTAYRLVHGEGDGLPGLIIDVYGHTAVMQAHSVGMHHARTDIAKALITTTTGLVDAVYYKSDSTLPFKAGLESADGFLIGSAQAEAEYENGLLFLPDWIKGQKTGFFIDQRENRALLEEYASGRKVLNMFCYSGGFSLYAMRGGACSVHSVDSSARAVHLLEKNMALNFAGDSRHHSYAADAFRFLDEMEVGAYDLIVLDPPAFAKHRKVLRNALIGYRKLNAAAFRKIAPGGVLFTFSCSQAVSREEFRLAVFTAAASAGRKVRILHQLTQPADHPINIYHPEGEYLKGLVLYVE
ncbi:SAM-dependent methyltransferase [Porphyromonas gulae]|uniref:class I SAM-dependent rRNA methyltransferase n=1 Tax=Porphyromonas gulae TaxID=111105 RepID=UPI00035D91E8|nr:class I SAM-dependent rRNA methyltransferase [Porphyromonas gulae]KGN80108.1 SAM-dependent methyltransferase [Porphyromonas gulae]